MTVGTLAVNGFVAERVLRPELTLSAVPEAVPPSDGSPAVIVEDHGYSLISVGDVPDEAIVRDERDPYIETDLELRYAWGDR